MDTSEKSFYYSTTDRRDGSTILNWDSKGMDVTITSTKIKEPILSFYIQPGTRKNIVAIPKSDKNYKHEGITKEVFISAYNSLLNLFHSTDKTSGDYYRIRNRGEHHYGLAWFTNDENNKMCVVFEISNDGDNFRLEVKMRRNWKQINLFRKAGRLVDRGLFLKCFSLVFGFISDYINAINLVRPFVENYTTIMGGTEIDQPIIANWQKDNTEIIRKLKRRIASIKSRLIDFDADSTDDRIRLRGEIEGLNYSINIINGS